MAQSVNRGKFPEPLAATRMGVRCEGPPSGSEDAESSSGGLELIGSCRSRGCLLTDLRALALDLLDGIWSDGAAIYWR